MHRSVSLSFPSHLSGHEDLHSNSNSDLQNFFPLNKCGIRAGSSESMMKNQVTKLKTTEYFAQAISRLQTLLRHYLKSSEPKIVPVRELGKQDHEKSSKVQAVTNCYGHFSSDSNFARREVKDSMPHLRA